MRFLLDESADGRLGPYVRRLGHDVTSLAGDCHWGLPNRRNEMTTTTDPRHRDRIVRNPAIMAGKPTVSGTRILADKVLGHLVNDPRMEELFDAYPELTIEDVQAVLDYALAAVEAGRTRPTRTNALTPEPSVA